MPPSLQELGLDRLSVQDRLAVADALWDSVHAEIGDPPPAWYERERAEGDAEAGDGDDGEELTPELSALIDRRLAEHERNPEPVYTWEEVKAWIRSGGGP